MQSQLFHSRQWSCLIPISLPLSRIMVASRLVVMFFFDATQTLITPWAWHIYISRIRSHTISTTTLWFTFAFLHRELQYLYTLVIISCLIHWFHIVSHLGVATMIPLCVSPCISRLMSLEWRIMIYHWKTIKQWRLRCSSRSSEASASRVSWALAPSEIGRHL